MFPWKISRPGVGTLVPVGASQPLERRGTGPAPPGRAKFPARSNGDGKSPHRSLPPTQRKNRGESRSSLPGFGSFVDYFTTVSHSRMRMVATWARVALPWGFRVVSVTPVISFWALAQARASLA